MSKPALDWFTSSGGPLLLAPAEWIEYWEGIDPPSRGRVVTAEGTWGPGVQATDYDRACDIQATLAPIEIGPGAGAILGGEPHPTAFVPLGDGGVLLRWIDGDTEAQVLRHLELAGVARADDAGDLDDDGERVHLEVRPGPLVLMDAACPGVEVEDDRLVLDLHPGRYLASARDHRADDGSSSILIRLLRID